MIPRRDRDVKWNDPIHELSRNRMTRRMPSDIHPDSASSQILSDVCFLFSQLVESHESMSVSFIFSSQQAVTLSVFL